MINDRSPLPHEEAVIFRIVISGHEGSKSLRVIFIFQFLIPVMKVTVMKVIKDFGVSHFTFNILNISLKEHKSEIRERFMEIYVTYKRNNCYKFAAEMIINKL